jgi:type IV pilus assembly protein PilO
MQQLNLSKVPWWAQILVVLLLAGAGAYAIEFYFISEITTEIVARETRLAALRREISQGLATAKRLPEFRAQVTDLERRLDALRAVLPEQKDVGDLLRRIQTLAAQSNLAIQAFTPQPIKQQTTHAEWPIALKIEGTYHNLGLFFDRISKFPRIINITNLKIKAKDKPDASATIDAECTATTFVFIEKPPAPAGKPGAKPAAPAAPAASRAGA